MPVVKKAKTDDKAFYINAIVSDKVKDHANDPFVLKSVEQAKEFLRKNGLKGLSEEHQKK